MKRQDAVIDGEKLRRLIEEAGFNPHSFSKEVGMSYANVHALVSGKRVAISLEGLKEFARVLGRTPGQLLDAILVESPEKNEKIAELADAWDRMSEEGRMRLIERALAIIEAEEKTRRT